MGGRAVNTTSNLTVAIICLAGIAILATLAFPYIENQFGSKGPENLYNCETHTIRQCAIKTSPPGMIDCLFTNNSGGNIAPGKFIIWNYDSEGIVIGTSRVFSDVVVPPGETSHIEFSTDKDAHESVICSMDPDSPLITRSTWTLLNNGGG
jgi:hypothetical protein